MKTLLFLPIVILATCGTPDCPLNVPLTEADLDCICAGEEIDSLPGCGDQFCSADVGAIVEGNGECDTGAE